MLRGRPAHESRGEVFGKRPEHVQVVGASDADGRFELECDAIPSFQFSLQASLAGWATEGWRWGPFESGRARDLETFVMQHAVRVHGSLVDAQGLVPNGPWTVWCHADPSRAGVERGAFRFEGLAPGRYLLLAETSSEARAFSARIELTAGEERSDVSVELPLLATLRGRLLGAAGSSSEATRAVLQPVKPATRAVSANWGDGVEVPVEADGSFEAIDVAAGEWDLLLEGVQVPTGSTRRGGMPARHPVVRVELARGESAPRRFDLGEDAPRTIDVVVRANGEPLPHAVVAVTRVRERVLLDRARQVGRDGLLRLGPLFPGEWRLEVQDAAGTGMTRLDETLFVGPGMPASLDVDVELSEGVLRLVDAEDGEPLASGSVGSLPRDGPQATWRNLGTDPDGRLVLTHAAGTIRLARKGGSRGGRGSGGGHADDSWGLVPWPPAPGEEPVVRLP